MAHALVADANADSDPAHPHEGRSRAFTGAAVTSLANDRVFEVADELVTIVLVELAENDRRDPPNDLDLVGDRKRPNVLDDSLDRSTVALLWFRHALGCCN
jgi:hypothetical protein